jgi:hypothetical protein
VYSKCTVNREKTGSWYKDEEGNPHSMKPRILVFKYLVEKGIKYCSGFEKAELNLTI